MCTKESILSLVDFCAPVQIHKINIFHMVKSKHPGFIRGRRLLIDINVIKTVEVSEDFSVDDDGDALYEYYGSG